MKKDGSEIVIYQAEDGKTKIDVRMEENTVWLTQAQMVDLFSSSKANISEHIQHIFEEGELDESSVVRKYRTTATDGKVYSTNFYNLDVIISVGYRVKSLRGTQFRRWALEVLREYLVKGFAMNDDALKNAGGGAYWKELLERIRDIRASEKVFYRQVLDLYATSVDYDPRTTESQAFFKIVQNKIHYAAHKHTAPEIVASRANAESPFMGLTSFKGEIPRKSEVGIAKNYLSETELATLNRMVSAYFDLAELRAMQHKPTYMKDWIAELDAFADRYGQGVLSDAGTVSHDDALEKAEAEYEKFRIKIKDDTSAVEKKYLDNLKKAQKKIESKGNKPDPGETNDKHLLACLQEP